MQLNRRKSKFIIRKLLHLCVILNKQGGIKWQNAKLLHLLHFGDGDDGDGDDDSVSY